MSNSHIIDFLKSYENDHIFVSKEKIRFLDSEVYTLK